MKIFLIASIASLLLLPGCKSKKEYTFKDVSSAVAEVKKKRRCSVSGFAVETEIGLILIDTASPTRDDLMSAPIIGLPAHTEYIIDKKGKCPSDYVTVSGTLELIGKYHFLTDVASVSCAAAPED